jgi:hypothetical protein
MNTNTRNTYTVLLGSKTGDITELDIPVDAVKSPKETQAAFHQRASIRRRLVSTSHS